MGYTVSSDDAVWGGVDSDMENGTINMWMYFDSDSILTSDFPVNLLVHHKRYNTGTSTVAMDRIRPEAMGAATSLFNLLRNIGGSVGIATVQTLLARYRQTHGNVMVGHVDAYSPASQILFNNLRSSFMAAGADVTTATQRAYAALYGMVQQHAAMLSFIDGFKLLAVVFLLLVPFVALMRKPQHHGRNR